jgi:hypothetical protein
VPALAGRCRGEPLSQAGDPHYSGGRQDRARREGVCAQILLRRLPRGALRGTLHQHPARGAITMKKQVKMLTLCRETLHHLATKEPLQEAWGGASGIRTCTLYLTCTNCTMCI